MALRAASLFAGVGGIDIALSIAVPGSRTVVYLERDAYAAATLVARMEDQGLDQAPIWDDATTFDGRAWRGKVDIVTGGFPCQDISLAGRGEGIGGKRSGLWSEIVRLADEIRPRYIFLENVSAITSRGLDTVLADLAEGGFDAEWLCLRASAVGAPHRRERWFCLAHTSDRRCDGKSSKNRFHSQEMADSEERVAVGGSSAAMDDTVSHRPQGEQPTGTETGATQRAGGVFPPGPADHDAWRAVLEDHPHLAPAVESGVRVLADESALVVDASRADQLRCCGNGVVPLQAAAAFIELVRRMNEASNRG